MALFRNFSNQRRWMNPLRMNPNTYMHRENYGLYNTEENDIPNRPNHILLFTIVNPVYEITVDALYAICKPSGKVLRIVIFEKNDLKALVEFNDIESAIRAKEALDGENIYSGCCLLMIEFARQDKLVVVENNSRSWDYTNADQDDSFDTTHRENRYLLINAELDKLFSLKPIPENDASSLFDLVATVNESLDSLNALGQSHNNWNCILVHYISTNLDHVTRAEWERTLEHSSEYPTLEQLFNFLTCRAKSLEFQYHPSLFSETSSTRKPFKRKLDDPIPHKKMKYPKYPCDCCCEDHFILYCHEFRNMSPEMRYNIVLDKELCLNCFARHDIESCTCVLTCRICNEQHHSMIHDAIN